MQFVSTKTNDGVYFKGLMSEAKGEKKKIIIQIHGMAGNIYLNSYYANMHDYYPASGIAFLAGEHRGSGTVLEFNSDDGIQIIGNAYEKFEDCVKDIQAWVNFAKSLGYQEIWLQAHSLGPSKIAYYYAQTKSKDICGLIFLSPSDMHGLVHDPAGIEDHKFLFPEAEKLVSLGKGDQLLSRNLWGSNKLSAATYVNFFSPVSHTAIFNYKAPELGWEEVNAIDIPVLAITGTRDEGIVTVLDAYDAMTILEQELKNSPRVKTIVYEDAGHGFEGFEQVMVEDVVKFIQN